MEWILRAALNIYFLMSDGMFLKVFGFMSHIHLGETPEQTFQKGRTFQQLQQQKQTWKVIG